MEFFRTAEQYLVDWKERQQRKPLIVKGARQVGKTFLLKGFGARHFPACHYFNFEKSPELAALFQKNFDVKRILESLSLFNQKQINRTTDLIIFDEIQACPQAVTSLKYFREDAPEVAICSAGSLLGVTLNAEPFPVGMVEYCDLFPLTFGEFLLAFNEKQLTSYLEPWESNLVLEDFIHNRLWEYLKLYFVIGGLPEILKTYRSHQDPLVGLSEMRTNQHSLITSYEADIAKHAGKINSMHIVRIWKASSQQLASTMDGSSQRFKFKDVVPGIKGYERLVGAIDWLLAAGLLIKVPIVHKANQPLTAYTKENTFKLFHFDVGILNAILSLAPGTIIADNYGSYKGYIAENYAAQALVAAGQNIFCWQENTAEIEFVVDCDGMIVPLEVKSGNVTKAKSLRVFVDKYDPALRIVASARNFIFHKEQGLVRIPLYLCGEILSRRGAVHRLRDLST